VHAYLRDACDGVVDVRQWFWARWREAGE
jgi:hypothetical protein